METYKGDINEFIDWLSGIDSFTSRNISGGLPISGASIRRLLQDRLKTPIVVYEDEKAGLFRMFSSEVARDRWISLNNPQDPSYDPDLSKELKLEIFNFERPSDFVLSTSLSSDPRYIISGDSLADAAQLNYTVSLKDAQGQTKSDSLIVTYTITNNITGNTTTFSEPYGSSYVNNNNNPISLNLYDYLLDGINSVNVNIKASTISNSIDIGFSVYLITFNLSSSFDFNLAKSVGGDIEVPFEINRSSVVSGSKLNVQVYIDGSIAKLASNGADALWTSSDTSARINGSIKLRNTYAASTLENPHVMHNMRIEATIVSGNMTFYSNVLYYTFEIASEASDIVNKFVNIGTTLPYNKMIIEDGVFLLQATQYEAYTLNWSYYTDQLQNQQSIPITWALKQTVNNETTYTPISTVTGIKGKVNSFTYIPDTSITDSEDAYLTALYGDTEINSWPIVIKASSLTVSEASGYNMKLTAFGKSNSSPTRDIWRDTTNGVGVTFSSGITWNSNSGWDDNSFMTIGENAYADINYVPFPSNFGVSGRTIEIEFMSEQVNDDNDILIDMGAPNAGRITITPTKATVWLNNAEVVSTHYKANERIKLCFIFNKSNNGQDSNLVYIVNNGILERAGVIGTVSSYLNARGIFRIGGSESGVRVYTIRAYPIALTYMDAYNNFVYDSSNKSAIINRNNIMSGGAIIYDECVKKIDTILIEGDLTDILSRNTSKDQSSSTVNITRNCVSDPTKNFTIINGKIRKHGQSTLNYPITSLKIWFNKSNDDAITPTVTLSSVQTAMGLNKNRYIMKNSAIPANKFVLQANYADSSGANNGAMERLIQDTWFKAQIDGEYKLRTAPQLFASGQIVHHNDANLGETGDAEWIEGYGENTAEGKTWTDIAQKSFPYNIRNSADSFPCAVFYRDIASTDNSIHFLGQYVFMDDKKSDHVFGERSIYHYYDETDPFCLKTDNKDEDKSANRVWNNNKVVRIEGVLLNYPLTSFMDYNVASMPSDNVNRGASVACDTIKYDEKGNKLNFYWEDYFEMIYPDPDDLTVKVNGVKVTEDKFLENSQFRKKAQYFLDFLKWITDIAKLNTGTKIEGYKVTQAALDEFIATAHDHIDPWKLAAYYIFFLRFGLVDSVERNAQWKTYDGLHWHCEPWDMDIAVGNKNDGGFAFYPPMTRNTTLPTDASTYAYSGRSLTTSNVLWDCLEAWEYWRETVVKKTAQALYDAGLKYSDVVKMFDDEYSNKWSEVMYNESGHFKYVEMRGNDNDWLNWLQGAALSHRHWWLSSSMNYYDAMWTVGDFNNHRVYIAANKEVHASGTDIIRIAPTSSTFFKLTQSDGKSSLGTIEASKENPALYDVSLNIFDRKDPAHIYGATFIEELDLKCFAPKLALLTLTGAYDEVLGAPIKKLDIGIPITETTEGGVTTYTGSVSGTKLALSASDSKGDALANIKYLNITGQQSIGDTQSLLYTNNRRTLTDFYAIGTGLTSFTSSASGNKFNVLQLPAKTLKYNSSTGITRATSVLSSFVMIDSSWNDISFWITETTDELIIENADEIAEDPTIEPVYSANPATFTNVGIPANITTIEFTGSTASNKCAADFILGWFDAIEAKVAAENPSLSGDDLEAAVLAEIGENYKLVAENISWGTDAVPVKIYYKDLARLAALNQGNNQNNNLTGYIKIADTEPMTSVQTTQLREWFGESVFNKSNINSGLIIDQELAEQYVQINIGKNAYIDVDNNGVEHIYLQEGKSATLNATKFLLSEDPDVYVWSYTSQVSGASVSIVEGSDGIFRLTAAEGTIGNYTITVTARNGSLSKSVDINIIGVTYPDDWVFGVTPVSGHAARKFRASENVLRQTFGDSRLYQYGSNSVLRDTYVIYAPYQMFEFYVESINGDGKTATYKGTTFSVLSVDTTGNMAETDSEDFNGDGQTTRLIDENYLHYNNGAIHNPISGIVLGTREAIPTEITRYVLTARINIGGTTVIRYLNLLMISDNVPIVKYDLSDKLYTTLRFNISTDIVADLYKTDLMLIEGTLQFSESLPSLVTEPVDGVVSSIFKYLPNVTTLNLASCSFEATSANISGNDSRVLNLSNMTKLQSLILTGANITYNETDDLIVDVSNNTALTSVASVGTSIGIKADYTNSTTTPVTVVSNNLATLTLGSPYYIYLKNTLNLDSCTVISDDNLADVHIENVNVYNVKGFNLFNTIFLD